MSQQSSMTEGHQSTNALRISNQESSYIQEEQQDNREAEDNHNEEQIQDTESGTEEEEEDEEDEEDEEEEEEEDEEEEEEEEGKDQEDEETDSEEAEVEKGVGRQELVQVIRQEERIDRPRKATLGRQLIAGLDKASAKNAAQRPSIKQARSKSLSNQKSASARPLPTNVATNKKTVRQGKHDRPNTSQQRNDTATRATIEA